MSVEIRKVLKYPPEAFLYAMPRDLIAGDNKVAEYSGFDPYILVIQGLSFTRSDGLVFHADVDGLTDVERIDNLASAKGIDYEELIKFPVARRVTMRITSPSNVPGYAWRHRVVVYEPTVSLKLQLGLPLTQREAELAERFGLRQSLSVSVPEPYNLYSGVEELRTVAVKMTSSGTVVRVVAPKGKKLVLLGVSASRPASPASAYLNVTRDNVDALSLDLYCLPSLEHEAPVRVVALEKLEATLDVRTAGAYYVRLVYGIGRITVREKIMWGIDLTPAERVLAEELDLYSKVEAGVT